MGLVFPGTLIITEYRLMRSSGAPFCGMLERGIPIPRPVKAKIKALKMASFHQFKRTPKTGALPPELRAVEN